MSDQNGIQRHADTIALGLALIVMALRAACAWELAFPITGDYLAYYTMAQRLVEGEMIKDQFGNLAYYNVGYPFALAVPFSLFGPSAEGTWLLNALLGGVSTYLVYRLARRISGDAGGGLFAALIWALYIEGYVYGAYVAKENLSAVLFLAQCLLVVRFDERRYKRSAAFALGGLSGLQALVGSSALAVLPALVWLVWQGSRRACAMQALIAFSAALMLAVGPWVARNHIELGAPVINTNGGFNLYLGNNPAATGYFVSIADTPLASQWHGWRERGELYADRAMREAARAHILTHPLDSVQLGLKKALLFWKPPLHEGKRSVHWAEHALRALWAVQYCALIAFALMGLRALPEEVRRNSRPVWLLILCYASLHVFFYIIFRYRFPIMPLVTVLAGMAAYALTMRIRAVRVRKRTTGARYGTPA